MTNSVPPETKVDLIDKQQRTAWIIFQVLAWIAVVSGVLLPISMFIIGRSWSEVLSYYIKQDVVQIVQVIFFLACAATLLRKSWAPHIVRATALWSIALTLHLIPHVLRTLAYNVFPFSETSFTAPLPLRLSISYIIAIFFSTIIVILAGIVHTRYHHGRGMFVEPPHSKPVEKLFIVTVFITYGVIVIRWFSQHLSIGLFDETFVATTYVLIVLTIINMIAQCFIHRHFATIAAINMSFVALFLPILARHLQLSTSRETGFITASCFPPISGFLWETCVMWLPMLLVGGIAFFSRKIKTKIRFISLAIPTSLMLIAIFNPGLLGGTFFVDSDSTFTSEQLEDWPDWLVPLEGASEVHYGTAHTFGIKSLHFKMQESYPATKVLDIISERLENAGFRKLEYDLLNPDILSAHDRGWSEHFEAVKPLMKVHSWSAEWINQKDEIVDVALWYRYPEAGPEDLNSLSVSIHLRPPIGWYKKEIEKYKRLHPTE